MSHARDDEHEDEDRREHASGTHGPDHHHGPPSRARHLSLLGSVAAQIGPALLQRRLERRLETGRAAATRHEEDQGPDLIAQAASARHTPSAKDPYNGRHRKEMRRYTGKSVEITDMNGKSYGHHADFPVDIGTVVGDYVLVFDHRKHPQVPQGRGWVKIADLHPGHESQLQIKELEHLRAKLKGEVNQGPGPGHSAPQDLSFNEGKPAKVNPHGALHKFPEDFLVRGGGSSKQGTYIGNYTTSHHAKRVSPTTVVGTWNVPGTAAHGKRLVGSGGVRAYVPINTDFFVCARPQQAVSSDDGKCLAWWVYGYAMLQGEPVYMWLMNTWEKGSLKGGNLDPTPPHP